MIYNNFPLVIAVSAAIYLAIVYLLLLLAQRFKGLPRPRN